MLNGFLKRQLDLRETPFFVLVSRLISLKTGSVAGRGLLYKYGLLDDLCNAMESI